MTSAVQDAVLAAEHERCAAMLANDSAALDALLDARLLFSHATGAVDSKAMYLAKLAAGRITYISIDWSDAQVISLADEAALLSGRMASKVKVENVERQLNNRVLAAWAQSDGLWRLVAFQSTPLML